MAILSSCDVGIYLQLMQDGAPGHASGNTKKDLNERGIEVTFWPPRLTRFKPF